MPNLTHVVRTAAIIVYAAAGLAVVSLAAPARRATINRRTGRVRLA